MIGECWVMVFFNFIFLLLFCAESCNCAEALGKLLKKACEKTDASNSMEPAKHYMKKMKAVVAQLNCKKKVMSRIKKAFAPFKKGSAGKFYPPSHSQQQQSAPQQQYQQHPYQPPLMQQPYQPPLQQAYPQQQLLPTPLHQPYQPQQQPQHTTTHRQKGPCSRCGHPAHHIDGCFTEHPELREQHNKKKALLAANGF